MPKEPKFAEELRELATKLYELVQTDENLKGRPHIVGIVYSVLDEKEKDIFTFSAVDTELTRFDLPTIDLLRDWLTKHFSHNLASRLMDNTIRRVQNS